MKNPEITQAAELPGTKQNMKSFRCSDGFVDKTINAGSAQDAAETYTIVTSDVIVTEVDDAGNEVGGTIVIRGSI